MNQVKSHNVIEGTAPAECTCLKLRGLTRLITQSYDRELAPSGLTTTQFSLLANARRRPGDPAPTVGELARALVTDRTTLTRNMKPLCDAGLIVIGPGQDGRSKAVRVSEAGERAYRAARPLWKSAQQRVREQAGVERIAALHALIDEMLPTLAGREGTL